MLTRIQAETMLTLQGQMNARVNPDWINAAYPCLRASSPTALSNLDNQNQGFKK